jgi:hypothetical protein
VSKLHARISRRVAAALLLSCGAVVAASVPALAHHPAVTATVDCDGKVTFTVVAWEGFPDDPATAADEQELSRTNGEIAVSVSLDDGQVFRQLPTEDGHRLDAGNGFTFTDSFQLPDPVPSTLILRARGLQTWGNSDELGGARQTPAIQVPACDETARDGVPPGTEDSYGSSDSSDSSAAGDDADGGSSDAYGETDGGSSDAYGSSDGDDADGGAAGGDSGSYGEPPADGDGADPGDTEPASASAPGAPVSPVAFTLGALVLAGGAAALIVAGLWARRRVLEL